MEEVLKYLIYSVCAAAVACCIKAKCNLDCNMCVSSPGGREVRGNVHYGHKGGVDAPITPGSPVPIAKCVEDKEPDIELAKP